MWLPRLLVLLLINKPDCMLNTFDIITLRKIAWGGDKHTDKHTHRQTDIATYRLNRPRGRFSENCQGGMAGGPGCASPACTPWTSAWSILCHGIQATEALLSNIRPPHCRPGLLCVFFPCPLHNSSVVLELAAGWQSAPRPTLTNNSQTGDRNINTLCLV